VPSDRYGRDVLTDDPHPRPARVPTVDAVPGLVVECVRTGWCGAVAGWQKGPDGWAVMLEDRAGRQRPFALGPSFLIDGELVTLRRPTAAAVAAAQVRTASGSVAVSGQRARIARASRIWVEGRHDAELVERVWGADLRVEGVVVEELGGVDELAARVREFSPGGGRRIGMLVDHLVPGSKETRIAEAVMSEWSGDVIVLGHPYVDVWQAVRPQVAGIDAWPAVPPGRPWKEGVCAALGWGTDTGRAWRALLAKVNDYTDLEPSLLGRVEELIDFVTEDD
jgi:predicted phosphodiesterase